MTKDLQTLAWLTKHSIPPEIQDSEIQDFWLRKGKKPGVYSGFGGVIVYHRSDEEYYSQGGPPPPLAEDILARGVETNLQYYVEGIYGKSYSESEMFRIIGLTAFL